MANFFLLATTFYIVSMLAIWFVGWIATDREKGHNGNSSYLEFIFKWYDGWIGWFWDSQKRLLYIFTLPFFGVIMKFPVPVSLVPKRIGNLLIDIKIREMLESDIDDCAKLIVDVYKAEGIWPNWTIDNTIRDLKVAFDSPKYKEKYFVAVIDNEIIGIGGAAESFMTTNAFELCYGTIKPEYQRKGIGTALTLKRIEYIKSIRKHGYIFTSARYPKFFDKLGFVNVMEKDGKGDSGSGGFCCLKY